MTSIQYRLICNHYTNDISRSSTTIPLYRPALALDFHSLQLKLDDRVRAIRSDSVQRITNLTRGPCVKHGAFLILMSESVHSLQPWMCFWIPCSPLPKTNFLNHCSNVILSQERLPECSEWERDFVLLSSFRDRHRWVMSDMSAVLATGVLCVYGTL